MTDIQLTDKERVSFGRVFTNALKSLAEGDAPSTGLRVMALRALRGIDIGDMTLRECERTATGGEIEALGELHNRAVLRGFRH